jgi:hypothetical protein
MSLFLPHWLHGYYRKHFLSHTAHESPPQSAPPTPTEAISPSPTVTPLPITTVTVRNAMQWNDFARSINESDYLYSESLTVLIAGRLDFTRLDFVPLVRKFNGTIRGTVEVAGYTEDTMKIEILYPSEEYSGGYGFYRIKKVESSGSLFGSGGDLTLENLVFSNIRTDDLYYLIADSIDTLTMRNIVINGCSLGVTSALLANNIGQLQVENLLVLRCNITLITEGGGLFNKINKDAAFSRIGVFHSDIILFPDTGGSGYGLGATALIATEISGHASFNDIKVYNCSVYSLNSVVLSQRYGSLQELNHITVESSSFLGFPIEEGPLTGPRGNAMLFGGRDLHIGHNILLKDSKFNAYGCFEEYKALGYVIKNCINIVIE